MKKDIKIKFKINNIESLIYLLEENELIMNEIEKNIIFQIDLKEILYKSFLTVEKKENKICFYQEDKEIYSARKVETEEAEETIVIIKDNIENKFYVISKNNELSDKLLTKEQMEKYFEKFCLNIENNTIKRKNFKQTNKIELLREKHKRLYDFFNSQTNGEDEYPEEIDFIELNEDFIKLNERLEREDEEKEKERIKKKKESDLEFAILIREMNSL